MGGLVEPPSPPHRVGRSESSRVRNRIPSRSPAAGPRRSHINRTSLNPVRFTLLLRLGQQLLSELLLIHRSRRLRRHLLCCCHDVDRVSHGLSPLGFQTSQFHRSADSPSRNVNTSSSVSGSIRCASAVIPVMV